MWTPGWIDYDSFYFLVLAHFRPKQLVDFSTYDTQILCLSGTIISKAHYNDKYNYVEDCEGLPPPQYRDSHLRYSTCTYKPLAASAFVSTGGASKPRFYTMKTDQPIVR